MSIEVVSVGVLACNSDGLVDDFYPRKELPNRKHLKLMSRADRLGIAAIGRAIGSTKDWAAVPPERRGIFVGTMPEGTEPDSLLAGILASTDASGFSVAAFGELGVPLVPPLWLVRGLSNNILGLASSYWDIRGVNGNRCEGRVSGLNAVIQGIQALQEHRADIVIAGGADSLVRFQPQASHSVGEGAAFVIMRRSESGFGVDVGSRFDASEPTREYKTTTPDVGAATGILGWVLDYQKQGVWNDVTVCGEDGAVSWLRTISAS